MNVEQMTPAEIDAELSELWQRRAQVQGTMRLQGVYAVLGIEKDRHGVYLEGGKLVTAAEAIERIRPILAAHADDVHGYGDFGRSRWSLRSIRTEVARWDAAVAALAEIAEVEKPFIDEFERRGGWRRYFLVTNANGHVHRGMQCSSCYVTTEYRWLVELADCDEAKMIEQYGEMACTVCFPDAPAHPAWSASIEARKAKTAAARCPGSGKGPVDGSFVLRGMGAYGTCPECGTAQTVTGRGVIRAHKPAKQGRARSAAIPVPESGVHDVEGLIEKIEVRQAKSNREQDRTVMTVRDDRGFKVWGTRPYSIAGSAKVGDRVRFTAQLSRSDRNPHFGFFKFPENAELLTAVSA